MSGSIRHTIEPKETKDVKREFRSSSVFFTLYVIIALIVVVVGVLAVIFWPRQNAPQQTSEGTLVWITSVPLTPTSSCPSIAPYVAQITAHEKVARWDKAYVAAESALVVSGLCDSDRKALTQYAVSDGMKDVYTQPFNPLNVASQQHLVDTYLALEKRAADADVAIDTPLQVASNAFSSSQFYLARVALEEGTKDGSFKPDTDRDITKMYVSTLFGLGKWYTTAAKDSALYKEGLTWLVASDRLAVKYRTGQGEAAMLLSQLVSADKSTWPPSAPTPLLP